MLTIAAIQMCSCPDPSQNIEWLTKQLDQLPSERPLLVVLPECFAAFGSEQGRPYREDDGDGLVQNWLATMAQQHQIWLLAGSLGLSVAASDKITASSLLYGPSGQRQARYDKRHLFDVDVADNIGSYRESDYTHAGDAIVVTDVAGYKLGLSICYDLRFPEHFRAMADLGVDLIAVPAAFTAVTGKAHWQPLLQARAIENQCYLVAAGQSGQHLNGRATHGHSMIIDPWGVITSDGGQQLGIIVDSISKQRLNDVQQAIPALRHRRKF
ncbi:carbon-nitrogen hydrolase family protein [Neiella marina]|uniref:Carbon-nitrogen hydrolase family protein n=1 Tax=Neiella holothuriorum TaxID=2870530 RepID=A0ABS7ECK2_9GAMM|nr:carbon-nitrogen hydrolase family protein [Neiella holothuriorum]MBW8189457.1 carbon-nitrogen hydrolase family protein [Neiella holothuriorum]